MNLNEVFSLSHPQCYDLRSRNVESKKPGENNKNNVIATAKLPTIGHGEGSNAASPQHAIKSTSTLTDAINGRSGTSATDIDIANAIKSTAKFISRRRSQQ
jgi:hypothetical protein